MLLKTGVPETRGRTATTVGPTQAFLTFAPANMEDTKSGRLASFFKKYFLYKV